VGAWATGDAAGKSEPTAGALGGVRFERGAFALEAGVAAHQLYEWRRSARRETPAADALVEVPRGSAITQWAAEVGTRSGPVQLSTAAAPAWAAQLNKKITG
jgi:transposase-like protein